MWIINELVVTKIIVSIMNITLYGTNTNFNLILDMYDLNNTHIRNRYKNGIMTFRCPSQFLVYWTNSSIGCYFIYSKFHYCMWVINKLVVTPLIVGDMNINLYETNTSYILNLDMFDLSNTHIWNTFKNGIMTFGSTTQFLVYVTH